jgi:polyhydroxyalkanoate synthesis repressor PhaR
MAYVIKRYSNRKLYDPQASRYVTLEELADMIRAGQDIAVTDSATAEDITSVILTQILLEEARQRQTALPTAFLRQLVQYGAAWQDFALSSLKANLAGLLTSQRAAEHAFRQWASQCGWLWPSPPAADATAAMRQEIATLQQELTALREQLQALRVRVQEPSHTSRSEGEKR